MPSGLTAILLSVVLTATTPPAYASGSPTTASPTLVTMKSDRSTHSTRAQAILADIAAENGS